MPASDVPHHPLGKNGPLVPAMGFGLMGLSHGVYGTPSSDEDRFAILDRAYEIGARFWDSADLYMDSDEMIGRWFKRTGKRDDIFLATKFGYKDGLNRDTSAAYTKEACNAILGRLGVPYIDLFYVHQVNPDTPIEETMRALAELKAEGKIKYIGLSTVSSSTVRRAVKIARVDAVQTLYSVYNHAIEGPAGTDLLATCRELGIAVVIATPLGRGILTGNFASGSLLQAESDVRVTMLPQFLQENRDHNIRIAAKFQALADKKGCTVPQLALAWLLRQGDDIFPTPGTKQIKYLEENWAALGVKLTDQEEAEIRAFGQQNQPAGGDVPPGFESHLFADTKEEEA